MASLPVKCHICGLEIQRCGGPDWELGTRKQLTYGCMSYKMSVPVPHHLVVEVVYPDEEIIYYSLLFESNKQLFQLVGRSYSILRGSEFPITALYTVRESGSGHMESQILKIARFYPLNLDDIPTHCEQVYQKIKPLIVFS